MTTGIGVGRPHPSGEPVSWMRDKMGQAARVARVDTDDDGKVSLDEYLAFSLPT